MDINGGDKNRVFLHDLIKITEGTVSEGTIFMHIIDRRIGMFFKTICTVLVFLRMILDLDIGSYLLKFEIGLFIDLISYRK